MSVNIVAAPLLSPVSLSSPIQFPRTRSHGRGPHPYWPAATFHPADATAGSLALMDSTGLVADPSRSDEPHHWVAIHTQGEVTPQNLWSQNDRHFVRIAWHNVWSWGSKSYCVIYSSLFTKSGSNINNDNNNRKLNYKHLINYYNLLQNWQKPFNWFTTVSLWSSTYKLNVFKRRHSNKHFWEFYPQDGGENQLA